MKIKVDKGIEMPERKQSFQLKYPFDEMEIGDSFSTGPYNGELSARVASSKAIYGKLNNMKFAQRKDANNDLRVWRIA